MDHEKLHWEEDCFYGDGTVQELWEGVTHRCATFLGWLSQRDEDHVVVVSSQSFLLALFNAVMIPEEGEAIDAKSARWFGAGEMRTCILSFQQNLMGVAWQ